MFDSMVLIGEEMSLASVQFLLILSMCIAGDESPLSDQQCGGKALYVILQQYQIDVSADDVLRNLPQNGHNSSLEELAYLANKFGLSSIGRRWVDDPPHRSPPAIIPVRGLRNSRHFVAVLEWQGENAIVQDGDYVATIPLESIRKGGWDGGALHIAKSEKELDVIRVFWSNHPRGRWFASGTIVLVSILLWMIPKRRLSGAD